MVCTVTQRWGSRVRRSLGTHGPPSLSYSVSSMTVRNPHPPPSPKKSCLKNNPGGCPLGSTQRGKYTCVHMCICIHVNTHTNTKFILIIFLLKYVPPLNTEVCRYLQIKESEVLGSDNHKHSFCRTSIK